MFWPVNDLPVLGPAPRRLDTSRLVLRAFEPEDEAAHHALCISDGYWTYPFQRVPTDAEIADIFASRLAQWDLGWGAYVVAVRETAEVIGQATLVWATFLPDVMPAVDLGWRLSPQGRGKGYATEVGRACARVAFEHLGVERCIVAIEPANTPSHAVADRLGCGPTWDTLCDVRGMVDLPITLRWCTPATLAAMA